MSKNSSIGDVAAGIFGILAWLYMIVSQIMTIVFFIGYCRVDDSLLEIIFIDSVLSELKGLLWIFFIW